MKRIIWKLFIILVILVFVYLIYLAYWGFTRARGQHEGDQNVLIIDMQGKVNLEQSDVLLGSEPFLAYQADQEGAQTQNPTIISFENLTQVIDFGGDNNGYIDQSNPYYAYIYLVLAHPDQKEFNYFSLEEAGFLAVAFEPDFIFAAKEGNLNKFAQQVGNLVRSNGQRVMLKMIAVSREDLDTLLTTVDPSQ